MSTLLSEIHQGPLPSRYTHLTSRSLFIDVSVPYSSHLSRAIETRSRPLEAPEAFDGREAVLNEFGHALRKIVDGRDFVDLGCCYPDRAFLPRRVARFMGARRYIGVDRSLSLQEVRTSTAPDGRDFHAFYIESDILGFLARLRVLNGVVFYLSGLEAASTNPDFSDRDHRQYVRHCLDEMYRVTTPGDAIVIGRGTFGFHPANHGFELISQSPDASHTIFVRRI